MRPSWETRGRQENGSRRHRLFRVLSGSSSPCERERIPRFFVPRSLHRVYTRISEASSRWVTRGCARCDSHSLLVPLEPRPVFPSVSKLNGNHARISLPLRQNGPRFHPPILFEHLSFPLSLSACPFFSSCSTFEIFSRSREISVPVFLHAIFEIFGKFEDRFARLASTKSRKSKSLGKVSWFCVCVWCAGCAADRIRTLCRFSYYYAFSFFLDDEFAESRESSSSMRLSPLRKISRDERVVEGRGEEGRFRRHNVVARNFGKRGVTRFKGKSGGGEKSAGKRGHTYIEAEQTG